MGTATRSALVICLAFGTFAACAPLTPPPEPPLRPPRMSPESVVLELFFIRVPMGDALANEAVWAVLDEQCLPPEVRVALAKNGFRMGFSGGQIPDELMRLMDLVDKTAPAAMVEQVQLADLEEEPAVLRRHMQLRAGRWGQIVSSPVHDELTVLFHEGEHVGGYTYREAQAMWDIRPASLPDGRVQLDLVPLIEYGKAQQRWTSHQGVLRLDAGRSRRPFDDLAVSIPMAPGELLVATSLADRPGSLAQHFLTEDQGGSVVQKVLVVRLAQTQHDEFFGPEGILQLDD